MKIGDKFPDLLGLDADGKEIRLSSFPGMKFIIYFYPKDSTPGCTAEARSLSEGFESLREMGYQIIGVSKDSGESHRKFADKNNLPFPLVADTELTLCYLADVWQKKKMAGREYYGIVRTTFITDEEGNVTDIIRKVDTKNSATQLFSLLEGRDGPNPA